MIAFFPSKVFLTHNVPPVNPPNARSFPKTLSYMGNMSLGSSRLVSHAPDHNQGQSLFSPRQFHSMEAVQDVVDVLSGAIFFDYRVSVKHPAGGGRVNAQNVSPSIDKVAIINRVSPLMWRVPSSIRFSVSTFSNPCLPSCHAPGVVDRLNQPR
jgi:hypothetical protein